MSVFKSKFTFTAAKEMTGEEKHSQYISAINSIHNCPAVCAWRNQSVSFWGFHHWKLILHIQRHKLFVTCQECAQDHTELRDKMKSRFSFLGACQYYCIVLKTQKHPNHREKKYIKRNLISEYYPSNREENLPMISDLVTKIDTLIYWYRQGVTFLGIHMPLRC